MSVLRKLPLYRVLLRVALYVLLPLLAVSVWLGRQAYQEELQAAQRAALQAAEERARGVERNLEQALQVLAIGAARLGEPALRGSPHCDSFPQDLLQAEQAVIGAWVLHSDGEPACSAPNASRPPALAAWPRDAGRGVWTVQGDESVLLMRHSIVARDGAPVGSFAMQLDAGLMAGREEHLLGQSFHVRVHWFEAPRQGPSTPASTDANGTLRLPVVLRGQQVAELLAEPAPAHPHPGRDGLARWRDMMAFTVAGLALLAVALVGYSHWVLRRDVAKLVQAAGNPGQALARSDEMALSELAGVARAMAAEQARVAQLTDALRRNAERLEEVQRTAAIGSWRLDLRDGSIEWSAQTHALYGVPADTVISHDLLEGLVHPADRASFSERTRALYKGQADLDVVHRVRRSDGSERVLHARATVQLQDEAGRPTHVLGTVQDITEAYGAARLNDALSGALFLTGDAVLLARPGSDGSLERLWANPAYDAVHGEAVMLQAPVQQQLFDAERGLLREQAQVLRDSMQRQLPARLEMELPMRQGRRWTEVDLIPVMAPQGGELHWLLVLRDISARHEAQQRVRDSERRYRALFDHHPLPMWTYDTASRRIMQVNQAAVRNYGYSRDEFLGKTVFDLHPEADREVVERYLQETGGRPPPAERRWRHQTASGHCIVVDIYGQDAPFDGPGHRLLCPVDRSAEQQALDALRTLNAELEATVEQRTRALAQREQQYRVLSDLSPQILWQADARGRVTYLNRAWYELVGSADEDWLDLRWIDALHPEDVEPTREAFMQASREIRPMRVRRRLRTQAGSYRSFLCVAAPVLQPGGEVESWVGVDTDITELERQSSRLQQLNDELESFSYSVSHDLRAPVQVMKGFLEAVLSGQVGQVDDRARHYLERVLRNARRMDELISDILSLSRVSRATLRLQRFDVAALARTVVETVQERYPDRVVECWTPAHFDLVADRGLLQAALENLMDNAAKFSQGRPVCRLEFTARRERDQVVLELADEGVGFPEEYAHRLFRPFQRLHSQEAFAGTGVGLATVARIAHLHGGEISGRNREGGGALFELRLPLMPELPAPQPVAEEDMA
ncbi:sensor histidine kinase [Eleftheria terrae]|uniref:sensor histidine kinase n=1 Tax=Eleftheria terrae TaxID=1597781 RepID=UPI00263AF23F|nr:PAS domain S-box protein [Eleftheria terrae]WKB54085.1 PAS domain S-box protein [Eleftheria terrae]